MTDDIEFDPVRRLAHDAATDATPLHLTTEVTTFDQFAAVTGDLADDIERAIRAEVDA